MFIYETSTTKEEEIEADDGIEKDEVIFRIAGISFTNCNCHMCDLQLDSVQHLKTHFQEKHEPITKISDKGDPTFSCKQCGSNFLQYASAIKHCDIRREIAKKQTAKCPVCSKILHMKRNLKRHMENHSRPAKQPIFCTKCQKLFRCPKSIFDNHFEKCGVKLKTHFPRQVPGENDVCFKCSICDYVSMYETALKKHMTTKHIGMLPGYIYKCNDCGKSYSLPDSLKAHKQRHHRKFGTSDIHVAISKQIKC